MKIYVRCLAAYNNGIYHGKYIDCTQGIEHIREEIHALLLSSPIPNAEEYAIHDFEDCGSIPVSEYESLESIVQKAEFFGTWGKLGAEVCANYGGNVDDATRALEDHYHGEYESEEDYARELIEETTDMSTIPDIIKYNIDYKSIARDLFIGDFNSFKINGMVHVFSTF
jgi:antirestriction protein